MKRILTKLTTQEKKLLSAWIKRDPLAGLYTRTLILYTLLLTVLLLWPFGFDFLLSKNNTVRWLKTSAGIEFPEEGLVLSQTSTESLCARLVAGSGFSLEAWLATENTAQKGPARIITYSLNAGLRNFTLGQNKKNLIMRIRTTETDPNGVCPRMEVPGVFPSPNPRHIVVTYDFFAQSVYIDGERRLRREIPGGKFTTWDPSYRLALGNEVTGGRPWQGKLYLVAIYDRTLSEQEVRQNYLSGWRLESNSEDGSRSVPAGLVVRYIFNELNGTILKDSGSLPTPQDLYFPNNIQHPVRPYLGLTSRSPQRTNLFPDVVLKEIAFNVLIFIPLGFLCYALLTTSLRASLIVAGLVFIGGAFLSFLIESLQYYMPTRHSSLCDLLANSLGMSLGIVIYAFYARYLESRAAVFTKQILR